MKNQAELHIKTKEPESEAVMIIQKPDILQFAREHGAELVYVDDDQVVEATYQMPKPDKFQILSHAVATPVYHVPVEDYEIIKTFPGT